MNSQHNEAYKARIQANDARRLKEDMLLQPLKDEAIKLIMRAATPDGVKVSDDASEYFVNSEGLVSWNHSVSWTTPKEKQVSYHIQDMPVCNILIWTAEAAKFLALRESTLSPLYDPTGLGI